VPDGILLPPSLLPPSSFILSEEREQVTRGEIDDRLRLHLMASKLRAEADLALVMLANDKMNTTMREGLKGLLSGWEGVEQEVVVQSVLMPKVMSGEELVLAASGVVLSPQEQEVLTAARKAFNGVVVKAVSSSSGGGSSGSSSGVGGNSSSTGSSSGVGGNRSCHCIY